MEASSTSFQAQKMNEEVENFCRIMGLVIDTGSKILRNIIQSRLPHGQNMQTFLKSKADIMEELRSRHKLRKSVFQLIQRDEPPVCLEDLDISTLYVMLRELVPGIEPPVNGWRTLPPTTDISMGADIKRLVHLRNSTFAHAGFARIPNLEFENIFSETAAILRRFSVGKHFENQVEADIHKYRWKSLSLDDKSHSAEPQAFLSTLEEVRSTVTPQLDSKTRLTFEESLTKLRKAHEETLTTEVAGSIKVNKEKRLSKQWETPVFEGEFDTSVVAVKIISLTGPDDESRAIQHAKELREVDVLRQIRKDKHPCILHFFKGEIKCNELYLAFELCQGTLADYVTNQEDFWTDMRQKIGKKEVMHKIALGLEFLHDYARIVHRDLKPSNILFHCRGSKTRVLISDFGSSKCTSKDECSMSREAGTLGWIAPEVAKMWNKDTKGADAKSLYGTPADVFAEGCVFFFIVSNGGHPFGTNDRMRIRNILLGETADLGSLPTRLAYMRALILSMISPDAEKRPTASSVSKNPAIQMDEKIMDFFNKLSLHMKQFKGERQQILENTSVIPDQNGNWLEVLPHVTRTYLSEFSRGNKRMRYDKKTKYYDHRTEVLYLLKAIRNCREHIDDPDFSMQVRQEIGKTDSDHVHFWLSRFPDLLHHLYITVSQKSPDFTATWCEKC